MRKGWFIGRKNRQIYSLSKQKTTLSKRTLSVFISLAFILTLAGQAGLFTYIIGKVNQANRTPHALSSSSPLQYASAADSQSTGKTAPIPSKELSAQLAHELALQQKGKQQNFKHVKLLDENRSANTKEYLNADGSKSLVYTASATSYQDDKGGWHDIDNTIVKDSQGTWHTKANAWIVSFGSSDKGMSITAGSQTFTLVPENANRVEPAVYNKASSHYVVYRNLWPGTDLEYQVSGSQVKENVILHSKKSTASYGFRYAGASLTSIPGEDGSYALNGAFSNFKIAAPTLRTAKSGTVTKGSSVTQTADAENITVSVSSSWLKSQSDKAFPVTVDPTVFNVPISSNYKDFTASGATCNPGQGCGNSIGYDAVYGETWRFAYQVTIPTSSGQYLASAKLHVEMPAPDGNDYGTTNPTSIVVDHAPCSNSFTCVDNAYGEVSSTVGTSADIELASMYRAAVDNSNSSPWMMVKGDETGSSDTYKFFDDTKTSMTFTYETLPTQSTIATGAPVDDGSTATTQPILKSLAVGDTGGPTDPDGPGPYQYRYIVGTGKNLPQSDPLHIKQGVTGVIADSGLLPQASWAVPANVLQDGKTYYWQPIIWDSYSGAAQVYGPVYSFKVDLRNGKDATQAYDDSNAVSVDLATGNLTTNNSTQSIKALAGDIGLGLDYNSPQKSTYGLIGQYWNDPGGTKTFPSADPQLTRTDPNVNFDWAGGSPYVGVITSDNFLVRWSGYFVAPQNGTYQFGTTSDDGSRVYVNGNLTADGWSSSPTDLYGSGITLSEGQVVPITYEFSEVGGNAHAYMLVKTTDGSITPRTIPTEWLQTGIKPVATPHGLIGHYYTDDGSHTFPSNANDPTRSFLTRTDTSMNLNWGTNAPVPNGPVDNFMVRWTGFFTAPADDTYTFGAGADDGVKVIVDGSTVVNAWTDHAASPVAYASSGITMSKGQTKPITIEYYEHSGSAQMGLYVKRASLPSAPDSIVDSSWLSPNTQSLPDGWNLSLSDTTSVSYDYAVIGQDAVVLYDSEGQSHEYKFQSGGFTPPAGESGHMVRNGDGTINLQDADGLTYVFNIDGTIKSVTTAADDLHPAALQYTYGSDNGSPAHLQQVTDGVDSSRWLKVYYSGNSNCPSAPSGFLSSAPANMICGAGTSDSRVTGFFYANGPDGTPRLSRVAEPGGETTDYGYDAAGRITQVRDSLANDAVTAGVRTQDGTELTAVTYDALGRVAGITLPAATAGATRLAHTYAYLPSNTTLMHVINATEPNGFTRKITYDGTFRTLTDTDIANLTTANVWDAKKDLVLSSTEPTGLETTNLYDYDYRKTDTYGPAPSSWFGTNHKPLTTPTDYTPQVPHTQTGYDESIPGLAAAYYDVTTASNGTGSNTKVLFGAPKSHSTGIGPANGDVVNTWNGTPPFTPDSGDGWGARLTGDIHLTSTGNYTFRVYSDDGVRLWIDDNLVIDDWNDGTQRSHNSTPFAATYNSTDDNQNWHRVRLDYYNKAGDSDARLELYMTPPGGTETSSLGSLLTPLYGLDTTDRTYDSSTSVGDSVTTNNYGSRPELGLLQSSTQDPSGLNLTTSYTYEAQGSSGSYLRQLSKTLPGGNSTNYTYYGATETRQNPCNSLQTFSQAGLQKLKTDPDPDGAGSQTSEVTETVYDNAGRTVATRIGSDPWKCYTYDDRDRMTQETIPALTNTAHVTRSARTVSYNYAVSANPLVSSISDSSGVITTTVDLLGRTVSYVDGITVSGTTHNITTNYTYDNLGRLITRDGSGTESYVYDNYNRLTAQKMSGTTVATPSYDSYGRLQGVAYNAAGPLALTISRDSLGRVNNRTYTFPQGSNTYNISDTNTLSQSGKAVSGSSGGLAESYSYDKAGRLTNASVADTYGTNTYVYGFGAPSSCTGTYNANAGKNSNRTSLVYTNHYGTQSTTNYCYDYADRLNNSSSGNFTSLTYDSHGNISQGNAFTNFEYDSSDRPVYVADSGPVTSTFDPTDRAEYNNSDSTYLAYGGKEDAAIAKYGSTFSLNERYMQLPGGVLMTVHNFTTLTASNNYYSLPNLHGDIFLSALGTGDQSPSATLTYDPFGSPLTTYTPSNNMFQWEGQNEKIQYPYTYSDKLVQMGARLYVPTLGRFVQPDPIEGGNDNSYVYPQDPVNESDLDGNLGSITPYWFDKANAQISYKVAKDVCGGWWAIACALDLWEVRGAGAAAKGGIYIVPKTSSGRIYVGQTNNFARRAAEHARSGKIPIDAWRLQIPIKSQKGRDYAERNILKLLGGKEAPWIENKINGPRR